MKSLAYLRSVSTSLCMLILLLVSTTADAQKMSRNWHEDSHYGFKFQTLDKFDPIPLQAGNRSGDNLIAKFFGPSTIYSNENNQSIRFNFEIFVFAFETANAEHEDDESKSVSERQGIGERLSKSVQWFTKDMIDSPNKTKAFKSKGFSGEYKEWFSPEGPGQKVLCTYSFPMETADIALVFTSTEDKFKKYSKVFNKAAKSLQAIDRIKETSAVEGTAFAYEDQLQQAQVDCEKTKGWQALPTPSQKFIIKTSSSDRKFIKEVIQRLEISRQVFEKDFPPPANFNSVSIVRICSNSKEFSSYGNSRPGVVGWFSPTTIELVLYDAKMTDRNQSFAVMSHEAFHQYCHFIFDQSEAHRWFDEGHGDYYGGIKIKGKRASITNKMPGGLNRLDIIKEMVRNRTYAPIKKHINYDHGQWQNQGPSNVSCYSQSWSIIYMLRQGALGKVKKKYWNKAYADIIPNYVTTLKDGYFELRTKKFKKASSKAKPLSPDSKEGRELWSEIVIRESEKEAIWDKAMDASWGQVDLEAFELHWAAFVKEAL